GGWRLRIEAPGRPPSGGASRGPAPSSPAPDGPGRANLLQRPATGEQDRAALASGGEDEEARRVVECVEQPFAVRADERRAEVETALREGKAVDLEAKRALAGTAGPAELGCRLREPGEHDTVVVPQLEGEHGRLDVLRGRDEELDHERLAGGVLTALVAFEVEQPRGANRSLPRAPLAQPGGELVRASLFREQPPVVRDRVPRRAVERD